jgi:toxin HigB-1
MIKSFVHKGLERFFYQGTTKGIQSKHKTKLGLILDHLDSASEVIDMNYPGSGFHALKGKYKDHFSLRVSGNWRIIFKFENGDAYVVDYLDYH